jgi:hypothetical protein
MAATAAYVNITAVPNASKSQNENVQFSNISATTAAFELRGGMYVVDAVWTGAGTVTLQRHGPDGTTFMTALTALSTSGTPSAAVQLPPGQYKIAVA